MDNNGVAGDYKNEGGGSNFLKGADFDGEGLVLEVVGMEKFTPNDPKFGVKNTYGAGGKVEKVNWFVKQNILEEGQSFKYSFNVEGVEKRFDNSSLSFYFAFTNLNPSRGDKILIKRNMKSQTNVEWTVISKE